MISLGCKTFVRKIWQNFFIAVEMAVTFILIIQIVSSVLSRIDLYMPVKDYFSGNGIVLGNSLLPLGDEETIKSEFEGVTDVHGGYVTSLTYSTSDDFSSANNATALDYEYINAYKPEMKSGKWLDEADLSGTIKAVVTESTFGFKTGDIIKGEYNKTDDVREPADIEIIGVVKDDSNILGTSQPIYKKTSDFRDLYFANNIKTNPKNAVIVVKEQLDDKNIGTINSGNILIKLNENYSEDEIQTIAMKLNNYGTTLTFSEFGINCNKYISSEIAKIIPLLICILVLLLVSSASLSGLSVKSQLNSYAIYYVLGAKWRDCIKINLISNIITSFTAIILTVCALNVINITGVWSDTVIKVGFPQVVCCLILIILNLIISLILPLGIMKTNTPKEILTTGE